VGTVPASRGRLESGTAVTTPLERMGAVRSGFGMLSIVVSNIELPLQIRQRAKRVLQDYPRIEDLEELLTRDRATLPTQWADAMVDARELLEELRGQSGLSFLDMFIVVHTLRHLPDEYDVHCLCRFPVLREWFAPEAA
jgi:hypothetical protein